MSPRSGKPLALSPSKRERAPGRAFSKAVLAAVLLTACATPLSALTVTQRHDTAAGAITVRSHPDGKPDDAATIAKALEPASEHLSKWGRLDQPVDVHVMPTHGDLESAVNRRGYDWLRAWAQYDDVLLQAPSTWTTTDRDVAELLAHELTHCLMYQRAATPNDWPNKGIPLWFREGMATWTAEQGYRWMTLEDLARVYEQGPGNDPIADAERLYQSKSGAVYAASHYAFTFLVRRYGTGAVERTLRGMQEGLRFDPAFSKGVGLDVGRFTDEFRRYVVWRGFRGSGRPVHAASPR